MEISLGTLTIIVVVFALILWLIYKLAVVRTNAKWQEKIPFLRNDIANKQRVTIKGKLVETFAPMLSGFPYKPSECKFLGDPIDYIVFEGLDERNIKAIRFVEVKSDASRLSAHQKQIKEIVDKAKNENITFEEFNKKIDILED